MNRRIEQSAYIESGKWDEKTIDRVYEEQLDKIGGILDQVQVTGLNALRSVDPLFLTVLTLFEQIEKELLIQWQIKRDGGLAKLFDRQRQWLNHELRRQDGLIATWNEYCGLVLQKLAEAENMLASNPWRSIVLKLMTDRRSYPGQQGGRNSTNRVQLLKNSCAVFKILFETCPYHELISFLNLIELGTGNRPDICDPGEAVSDLVQEKIPQELASVLTGLDVPDAWTGMPDRLVEYWGDADSSND